MSYILDALKKVEERDEEAGVPALLSCPGYEAPEINRRRLWPYPLAAALLLNAAVISWSIYSRPGERHATARAPVAQIRMPVTASAVASKPRARNEEESSPENGPRNSSQDRGQNRSEKRGTGGKGPALMTRQEGREAPSSSASKMAGSDDTPVHAQNHPQIVSRAAGEIFTLDQLPLSVRSILPAFKVSGHAYSPDPASRVVRINEQILQEGQSLAPGLKVEEITPEGILLNYRGYHFQIGFNNSN